LANPGQKFMKATKIRIDADFMYIKI
jgi:hypothetical protein